MSSDANKTTPAESADHEGKNSGLITSGNNESWKKSGSLTVVVVGASGDLAK